MEDHSVCNLTSSDVDGISEETEHPAGQLPQPWEFSELRVASEAGRELEGGASVGLECNIDPVDEMIPAASTHSDHSAASDYADDISSAASDHLAVQYPEAWWSHATKRPKSELKYEILELVLSYLSVPSVFRARAVCTRWKQVIDGKTFLDRWEQNGGRREYLFVTRYLSVRCPHDLECHVDDAYWRTTCFLDLAERRWYRLFTPWFPVRRIIGNPLEHKLRLLAPDDGLVCELSWMRFLHREGELILEMLDPLTRQRRVLPDSTHEYQRVWDGRVLPVIVTVVSGRTYKVFLMKRHFEYGSRSQFFVYEGGPWLKLAMIWWRVDIRVRDLRGQLIGESAVFFRGYLYIAVRDAPRNGYLGDTIILSYNLAEATWREVLAVGVQHPQFPQLIVSRGRMFLAVWSAVPDDIRFSYFEIKEIFVDPSSSTSVVRIPYENLRNISGEDGFSIQWGFPLSSVSVLLLTRRSGRLLTYDLRSRAVGVLPPHPLRPSAEDRLLVRQGRLFPHYRGRLSKLSLRNILSVNSR